jgi:hypothetical protein
MDCLAHVGSMSSQCLTYRIPTSQMRKLRLQNTEQGVQGGAAVTSKTGTYTRAYCLLSHTPVTSLPCPPCVSKIGNAHETEVSTRELGTCCHMQESHAPIHAQA